MNYLQTIKSFVFFIIIFFSYNNLLATNCDRNGNHPDCVNKRFEQMRSSDEIYKLRRKEQKEIIFRQECYKNDVFNDKDAWCINQKKNRDNEALRKRQGLDNTEHLEYYKELKRLRKVEEKNRSRDKKFQSIREKQKYSNEIDTSNINFDQEEWDKNLKEQQEEMARKREEYRQKKLLDPDYEVETKSTISETIFDEEDSQDLQSNIETAKSICKEIGFKIGTEKFGECVLKLYSEDKLINKTLKANSNREREQQRQLDIANQRLELEKRRIAIEEERANRDKWNSISKGLKDLSNTLYPNSNQQNNNTNTNRRMNCTNNNSNLPNAVPSVTCREF